MLELHLRSGISGSTLTFAHDLTISNTDCTIGDCARIVMQQGLSGWQLCRCQEGAT